MAGEQKGRVDYANVKFTCFREVEMDQRRLAEDSIEPRQIDGPRGCRSQSMVRGWGPAAVPQAPPPSDSRRLQRKMFNQSHSGNTTASLGVVSNGKPTPVEPACLGFHHDHAESFGVRREEQLVRTDHESINIVARFDEADLILKGRLSNFCFESAAGFVAGPRKQKYDGIPITLGDFPSNLEKANQAGFF